MAEQLSLVARFALAVAVVASVAAAEPFASGAATAPDAKHSEHRVIVRYGAKADDHVGQLGSYPGVVLAQALPRLGMAVVSLSSAAQGEQLVETLRDDDAVELAVLDTFVHLYDFLPPKSRAGGEGEAALRALRGERPLEAACSAHPACRMRGLTVGPCCPVPDGTMLSCCSASGPDLVSFATAHGRHLAAGPNGEVFQQSGPLTEAGKWSIVANDDGTIMLRSTYGKYMAADAGFNVHADLDSPDDASKLEISRNSDHSVSLSSRSGRFVSCQNEGSVVADRHNASASERFAMLEAQGPGQHFAHDPELPRLWGMHHWAGYDIDAPEAWKIWTGEVGRGITVGIIDTGIDYTHEDLREQMWVNPLEIPDNGIDDDENGYIDDIHGADFANQDGNPMDDQKHGTHCAGTIAGVGNNEVGIAGVAWRGVRLMALKFLTGTGAGRTSDAIRAIEYGIAHGAKVLSNSWGGASSNPALETAIARASRAGVLFTAAAGNEGQDNDAIPSYPANYESENVISVAATTWLGEAASFSNIGATTVDVAAPGAQIYSSVPGGGYEYLDGTSMACPHVAGLAALVWSYRPQLSMKQVRDVVMGSVRALPSLQGKVATGGLINAKNALEAAWAFEPPRPPKHAPRGIAFTDVDSTIGLYSGVVTITAAEDESDIEYYQVYFVSGAGFQLEPLGERVPASGASELEVNVSTAFKPADYARYLAVVSGRQAGEMPVKLHGADAVPYLKFDDFGLPLFGARSAAWGGDRDLCSGFVSGNLTFKRAVSEETVTKYNIYWQKADGSRGTAVGSVDAFGFREPVCEGASCGLIEQSITEDGAYRFERLNYSDSEAASILTCGPGSITVLYCNTETTYDKLVVGDRTISGNLAAYVPYDFPLEAKPVTIQWSSDDSIHQDGWAIELRSAGAQTEFQVKNAKVDGVAFEIVPAWRGQELRSAVVVVQVADLDEGDEVKLGPSVPAPAPAEGAGRRLAGVEPGPAVPLASEEDAAEAAAKAAVKAADKAAKLAAAVAQPWLPRAPAGTAPAEVIWAERPAPLTAAAAAQGVVRLTVSLEGLTAKALSADDAKALRTAVASKLAKELQRVAGPAEVRTVRLADAGGSLEVLLEVECGRGAVAATLDYVEAHAILLSSGGAAAAALDRALAVSLEASGISLPGTLQARVGAPQKLGTKVLLALAQQYQSQVSLPADGARRLRGTEAEAARDALLV